MNDRLRPEWERIAARANCVSRRNQMRDGLRATRRLVDAADKGVQRQGRGKE
jgi:hypothetical protein